MLNNAYSIKLHFVLGNNFLIGTYFLNTVNFSDSINILEELVFNYIIK